MSLISNISQTANNQNLAYEFLKESQQTTTQVELDQQPETQPEIQPEMRREGRPGRAIVRVATEYEVKVIYGTAALLNCDCSYRGLIPHQTYMVWGTPKAQLMDFSNYTEHSKYIFVNGHRRNKVKGDCSVLIPKPQPEDQGFYECMQFGVRIGQDIGTSKDPETEHRFTRINLILLDNVTGEPIPIPSNKPKELSTTMKTTRPTTMVTTSSVTITTTPFTTTIVSTLSPTTVNIPSTTKSTTESVTTLKMAPDIVLTMPPNLNNNNQQESSKEEQGPLFPPIVVTTTNSMLKTTAKTIPSVLPTTQKAKTSQSEDVLDVVTKPLQKVLMNTPL